MTKRVTVGWIVATAIGSGLAWIESRGMVVSEGGAEVQVRKMRRCRCVLDEDKANLREIKFETGVLHAIALIPRHLRQFVQAQELLPALAPLLALR